MLACPLGPPPPLLWRVFLTNAAMLAVATLALALSPATVSFPVALTEALVLGGGLAATLTLDFVLLSRTLSARRPPVASLTAPGPAAMPELAAPRPGAGVTVDRPELDAGAQRHPIRLIVGWTRPQQLSEAEAEDWARRETAPLLAAAGVTRARLVRLGSASSRYHRPWDWLLELDVAPGRDVKQCVESAAWGEWLGDLRLLGLGPAAMVATRGRVVSAEEQ